MDEIKRSSADGEDRRRRQDDAKRAPSPEEVRQGLHARIEIDFRYHMPGPDDTRKYEAIRSSARAFAHLLVDTVPPGRELSRALTHLEDAVMSANAGVARGRARETE